MFFQCQANEKLASLTPENQNEIMNEHGKVISIKHYHECEWFFIL